MRPAARARALLCVACLESLSFVVPRGARAQQGPAPSPAPSPAPPPAPGGTESARAEFQQGVAAFAAGEYARAIQHFEGSLALVETPAARLNLSLCLERVGRVVEARGSLARYEALARGRMPPGREEQLREARARLDAMVVRVRLRTLGAPSEVSLDGRALGESERAGDLELDPGTHRFRAAAPQATPAVVERIFQPGERAELVLAPEPLDLVTRLRVQSTVPSAEIAIDSLVLGSGAIDQRVQPGSHALAVRARGYLPYLSSMVLAPGEQANVQARLVREVPLTERPWLWIALGTVLAGAVVGVAVAADARRVLCVSGSVRADTSDGCVLTR